MSNTRLQLLVELYLNNQLNFEERKELLNILSDPDHAPEADKFLEEFWTDFEPETTVFSDLQSKRILNKIFTAEKTGQPAPLSSINRNRIIAVAAILLLVCSVSLWFIPQSTEVSVLSHRPVKPFKQLTTMADAAPGGSKALLTLADGRKIELNDLSAGEIVSQSGIQIKKTEDGQLVYTLAEQAGTGGKKQDAPVEYNTVSTPKGGQYQVNLPDGSKVWLNSMSSLKFPTSFQGIERKVELTGEAYFEISSFFKNNVRLPFKVLSGTARGGQQVDVLGTHFNISNYGNESSAKTTLVEGRVSITNLKTNAVNLLSPGQQAILSGENSRITRADLEEALAWKNGNFMFNNLGLADIMKELERWYDVKVDYSNIPDTRYHGSISKNVSISQVLNMLELTGRVRFKIETIPGKSEKIIRII